MLVDLNQRPFKKLPGCRRSAFEALDAPALRPLPLVAEGGYVIAGPAALSLLGLSGSPLVWVVPLLALAVV